MDEVLAAGGGSIAAIYTRVSTEDQASEGLSLETQVEECVEKCLEHGFDAPEGYRILEQASGASLDRPGLEKVRTWIRAGTVDAVCYFSPDRLSRDAVDLLVLIREFQRAGVQVLSVHQPPQDDPLGRAMTFLAGTFAEVERKEISERTMRGKRKAAQLGRIPAGLGRYGGPYGLRYDKASAKLVWVSGHHRIVAESILRDSLSGKSISSITVALNDAKIPSASGGVWHTSSVQRVLSHARTYAGDYSWAGIEIPDIVEDPVIYRNEVDQIAIRLQKNKERAKGWGRRHLLTGRVFGECGRRYSLDRKKGAYCGGDDSRRAHRCGDPRLGVRKLESAVYGALDEVMSDPTAIRNFVTKATERWQSLASNLEEQRRAYRRRLSEIGKQRRLLSFQHQNGIITDGELIERVRASKVEGAEIENLLGDLDKFAVTAPPDDIETLLENIDQLTIKRTQAGLSSPGNAERRSSEESSQLARRLREAEDEEHIARRSLQAARIAENHHFDEISSRVGGDSETYQQALSVLEAEKDDTYMELRTKRHHLEFELGKAAAAKNTVTRKLEVRNALESYTRALDTIDLRVTVRPRGLVIQARVPFDRYRRPASGQDEFDVEMLTTTSS